MSKNIIWIILALVVLGIGGFIIMSKSNTQSTTIPAPTETNGPSAPSAAQTGKNEVTIENMTFSPATVTVKEGDSVTWTNKDTSGHSATADDGSFDTGILDQGGSKTIKFAKTGTYTYHCVVHPNMKGTIVVEK